MLFNSYPFLLVFLPLVLLAFTVSRRISHALALATLLAASFIFYGYWDPRYVGLLAGSIVANYSLSLVMHRLPSRGRLLLTLGVAANLCVLGWFKYAYFLQTNLFPFLGGPKWFAGIVLPLGISFFTFEQIAYLTDVKRGRIVPRGFMKYALFVTFFPHLIAGPIILYQDLANQFETRRTLVSVGLIKFHSGLILFAIGLAKKVIVADSFAQFATPVFAKVTTADPALGAADACIGAVAYSLQLYFDFSGYSDMAVGLARMLGYRLPFNFNSPYKATGIIDFWRRWHMSLTNFFRKYVYIPLGGNREGLQRQAVNVMVVFFLTGLWHGAGWTFILWGTIHGLLVLVNLAYLRYAADSVSRLASTKLGKAGPILLRVTGAAVTLTSVILLWVLFRAADLSAALRVYEAMWQGLRNPSSFYTTLLFVHDDIYRWAFPVLLLAGGCVLWLPNSRAITAYFASARPSRALSMMFLRKVGVANYGGASAVFVGTLLFSAITLIGRRPSEFLYFQF